MGETMPTAISNRFRRHAVRVLQAGVVLLACLAAAPLAAHVALDEPNGGEVLPAGSSIEIQWHVLISHDTENWDLAYSATGDTGPWITIVEDLGAGDITSNAMHSYLWTVPNEDLDSVRVRVIQDNSDTDYSDTSDDDLTIEPLAGAIFLDGFDSGDASAWSLVVP